MKKFTGKIQAVKDKTAAYILSLLICDDSQKWIIEHEIKDLISNMRIHDISVYHACNYGIQFDITYTEAEYKNGSLKVEVTIDNICTGNIEIHDKFSGALLEAGSPDIIEKYNPDTISIFYEKIDKWDLDFIPYAV